MICRRPTALTAALAVTLGLVAWTASARAAALSSTATYVLTSSTDIPASSSQQSGPLVIFEAPAGSIVPPVDPKTFVVSSPVTPIATPFVASNGQTYTTDPQYTNSNNVFVFTRPSTSATGQPVIDLGFAFHNALSHNSAFVFALNVADPNHPPTLHSLTPGVPDYVPTPPAQPAPSTTLATAAATSGGTALGGTPVIQPIPGPSVPEPVSLALWSGLTVAGLFRVRAIRHRRAV